MVIRHETQITTLFALDEYIKTIKTVEYKELVCKAMKYLEKNSPETNIKPPEVIIKLYITALKAWHPKTCNHWKTEIETALNKFQKYV